MSRGDPASPTAGLRSLDQRPADGTGERAGVTAPGKCIVEGAPSQIRSSVSKAPAVLAALRIAIEQEHPKRLRIGAPSSHSLRPASRTTQASANKASVPGRAQPRPDARTPQRASGSPPHCVCSLRHPTRRPRYTSATNKPRLGFGLVAQGNLSSARRSQRQVGGLVRFDSRFLHL
jgi:hypothetical protein